MSNTNELDKDVLDYVLSDEISQELREVPPLLVRLRNEFKGDKIWLDFKFALRASFIHKMEYDRTLRPPTPSQLDIADYLQYGDDSRDVDEMTRYWSIVQACRGLGKTFITTTYICWLLSLDPTLKIMIVSKNQDFSEKILQQVRDEIRTNPLYASIRPSADTPRDNTKAFYVNGAIYDKDPSVSAWSIEGKLQGMRADVIIGDDVESTQNSATRAMCMKLSHNVKEFINILKPGGIIVMLGTPQITDTLYHKLVKNGYNLRIWPALYPTAEQMARSTYGPYLAPNIRATWTSDKVGTLADPLRFTLKNLMDKKLGVSGGEGSGTSAFELQYMLDPSLTDSNRFPLKCSELMVYSPIPEIAPNGMVRFKAPAKLDYSSHSYLAFKNDAGYELYEPMISSQEMHYLDEVIMAIDPAASTSDELGYAILGRMGGYIFLLRSGGLFEGTSTDSLKKLAELCKEYSVSTVVPEKNFGAGMFGKLLRPVLDVIHPCHLIDDFHVTGQKEVRIIRTLEPLINSHRLLVHKDVVAQDGSGDYSLLGQMNAITFERNALIHDDRLDALALGCKYLQDRISFDIDMYNEQQANHAKQERTRLFNAQDSLIMQKQKFANVQHWTDHSGYDM